MEKYEALAKEVSTFVEDNCPHGNKAFDCVNCVPICKFYKLGSVAFDLQVVKDLWG